LQGAAAGSGPWILLSSVAASPSVVLTWIWRTQHRDRDYAIAQQNAAVSERNTNLAHRQEERVLRARQHDEALSLRAERNGRFLDGVKLLAGRELESRLGGIYSLEALAKDSEADRDRILDTLSAFVRSQGQVYSRETAPENDVSYTQPPHVEAALRALSRIERGSRRLDLRRASLAGCDAVGINLDRADLRGADLRLIEFSGATIREAVLDHVLASGAVFRLCTLDRSTFNLANLEKASFDEASMGSVQLKRAKLADAAFGGASLDGASFVGADLTNAEFPEALLSRADFTRANLDNANFSDARIGGPPRDDPDSARLAGAINLASAFFSPPARASLGLK
jgi:uncharacterized protein YjbI with pentapeptide repeats